MPMPKDGMCYETLILSSLMGIEKIYFLEAEVDYVLLPREDIFCRENSAAYLEADLVSCPPF